MSKWKEYKLGDICEVVRGGSPRPIIDYITEDEDGVNWLKIGDVKETDKYFTFANEKIKPSGIAKSREVTSGDIILSNSMSFGRAFITLIDGYIHDGWLRIRCSEEVLDKEYLYYFLTSSLAQNQFKAVANGSVVNNLKSDTVKAVSIDLPPLDEQKRISSILSIIDEKINNNNHINDNLEQQAEIYFYYLFIDNPDPSWQKGTIGDIGTVVGGSTPSKAKPEYYTDNGIAWITPKDLSIDKSKFISHGADDITELGLKNSSASIMPTGTVLFSSRAPIGYIAIADGDVTTNQGFKSVVPKNNVGTAFVYYFLKNALPTIENMASGSTFKEISGSAMRTVPVMIPDDESLQKFADYCEPLFQQQRTLETENRSLVSLRDSLLPKLMSGELDVSDIDI